MPFKLSFLYALVLLTSANVVGLCYGEKQVLSLRKYSRTEGRHENSSSSLSQESRRENGSAILEMQCREYLSGRIKDRNRVQQRRLVADNIRVSSIQSRIKNMLYGQSEAQIPIYSGVELQTLNYVVTVTLGGRNRTLIVDTGSDLTWVQCQPCRLCYTQPEPLFDPSLSPSYQTVGCDSPPCKSLQFATGNWGSCSKEAPSCYYSVSYGDGSYTRGELGLEQLILGDSTVKNFLFGCGRNNKGLFGEASGLMGLGRSNISLISQTYDMFQGVFSYCLPSTAGDFSSGSLTFGDDHSVYKNTTPISYTTMVPNSQLFSFYILNLTGISIGGVDMQASSFGKKGIILDSGTVITRLPPSVYQSVKSEFLKQFSGYPTAPAFSILDTCFNLSKYDEVNIPTMRMTFEGEAALTVDVTGVFYFVKSDATQVCLALASLAYEDEMGIIGNFQQRNTRVVYDTRASTIGFAKESCSY